MMLNLFGAELCKIKNMAAFPLTALSLCVHHLHKHVVRGVEPTLDM